MSDMTCQDTQHLMHAYFDRELDLVRSLEMEGHLQTCPACAQVLANHRTLQGALRSGAFYYDAPAALQAKLRSSLRKTPVKARVTRRTALAWSALAASIIVVGFGLGWLAGRLGNSAEDALAREVVSSHVRSLMATHLTDVASSNQHTVKPWFHGQLDFSPPAKDFSKEDFSLVGGRLDYVGERPVAGLVYQRRKHFINLFIWPSSTGAAAGPTTLSRQGYHLIHWSDAGMTFWAVSDLNEKELEEFVKLVRS
jgi:anti-sigma factor RsiW